MPYGDFPSRADVIKELQANLLEKYHDLKAQGKSDEAAYQMTIDSFGDVTEIMEQLPHNAESEPAQSTSEKSLRSTLKNTLKHAKAGMGLSRFGAVALEKADLSDSNLAGEDFSYSALVRIIFDRSNLNGAAFRASALKGANFDGATLARMS